MGVNLKDLIGRELESYTFKIESGKIRELALAIGDNREEYLHGERLLPTFPTVIEFWGGQSTSSQGLGLNMAKVLHGEQEYEYLGKIIPGDDIKVNGYVEDAYTKAKMNFVVVKREFRNQDGELVLISRSTIIERH